MLFRKSNKFKLLSMILIAASLSTGLVSCGSSSKDTSSNVKEEAQNKEEKNSDKDTEEAKDTNKASTSATSKETEVAPVQNPEGVEEAIKADDSDYHSAQAVDNANSKQEGFVESDTVETAPEGKVYIMQGSTKYHTKSKCGKLTKSKCIDKNIAEAAGYSACPDCADAK